MPSEETWRFINSFAPWLSALGTLAAVVVSLWLAQRSRRINLAVRASLRIQFVHGGAPGHGDRFVSVNVINRGLRGATVSTVGWRLGLLRKQELFTPNHQGTALPAKIEDGDEAAFLFPLDDFASGLLDVLPRNAVLPFPYMRLATMKAIVATTAGKPFYTKISKDLRHEIARRAKEKWRKSN